MTNAVKVKRMVMRSRTGHITEQQEMVGHQGSWIEESRRSLDRDPRLNQPHTPPYTVSIRWVSWNPWVSLHKEIAESSVCAMKSETGSTETKRRYGNPAVCGEHTIASISGLSHGSPPKDESEWLFILLVQFSRLKYRGRSNKMYLWPFVKMTP